MASKGDMATRRESFCRAAGLLLASHIFFLQEEGESPKALRMIGAFTQL
jgi:hypothetical protein